MALLTFQPEATEPKKKKKHVQPQPQPPSKRSHHKQHSSSKKQQPPPQKPPSTCSWDHFKNLLTCKQIEGSRVHDPSKNAVGYSKLGSSCSSICSFKDVVHGNTTSRVVHRADNSPDSSSLGQETGLLSQKVTSPSESGSASRSNRGGGAGYTSSNSSRGMQFRKLSGCYECHYYIVDPSRYPVPRSTICSCPHCGEIFPKLESLELHQSIRHAVSELGLEDSGRNIVEIIFKSSWLKKDSPICRIERIVKVQNTQRTIQRFEDCRDAVKNRALNSARKNPRCAADGNELLRFHCTSISCTLGARGSTNLCGSVPGCGVCTTIRHGLQGHGGGEVGSKGVRTTASSGRAHDSLRCTDGRRAMLVCRVIAGRVRRVAENAVEEEGVTASSSGGGTYDSVAGYAGVYSNLEELVVFNPRAILPCFVVIYKALDS